MSSLTDGLHLGVDHDEYHADPALSSTQIRLLVEPSCPAKFRWEVDHRESRTVTEAMDFGQAYHTLAFGAGPEVVEVGADSWRTKDARQGRDALRAAGKVPILTDDLAAVRRMVDVLRADAVFASLTRSGEAEASFWWHDLYGIHCRGRVDWLPTRTRGRLIVPDLKSTRDAFPAEFGRSAADLGYAQQADWYLRGLRAIGEADERAVFVFVAQEKTPPYLVQTIQLTADSMRAGEILNDRALETYARCIESDTWPGYHDGVALASLPGWYLNPILESE